MKCTGCDKFTKPHFTKTYTFQATKPTAGYVMATVTYDLKLCYPCMRNMTELLLDTIDYSTLMRLISKWGKEQEPVAPGKKKKAKKTK